MYGRDSPGGQSVTVIGGANLDINGFSRDPLIMADSNPGRVEYCPGGVGRNIAENLHRLGADVRFIGVIGDDPGGELIRNSSAAIGLNIKHSLFVKSEGRLSSVYIALMDSNGEMKLALADMDVAERMTKEHLESKAGLIAESAIVVLDANLPEKIICFILDRFGQGLWPGQRPGHRPGHRPLFFLDTVSARKAPRAASRVGSVDTLKLGLAEASAVSGVAIPDEAAMPEKIEKLGETAAWFCGRGARRVFITLGKEGVFACGAGKQFFRPAPYVKPLNTSGGGDAFMAGIVYGTLRGWDEEIAVSFSLAMARITVQSGSAVSPDMNLELVQKNMDGGSRM